MKALGAEFGQDAAAAGDLRADLQPRGEVALFLSRRRGARPAPLVLHDPVLPADTTPDATSVIPPDNPSDRAVWIARQLAADCFHFARPGPGRR